MENLLPLHEILIGGEEKKYEEYNTIMVYPKSDGAPKIRRCIEEEIGNKYNLKKIIDTIKNYFIKKNIYINYLDKCITQMYSKLWINVYKEIGMCGIYKLFIYYDVLEIMKSGVYLVYFIKTTRMMKEINDRINEKLNQRAEKKKKGMKLKIDKIDDITETDIFGEGPYDVYEQKIKAAVQLVHTETIKRMIRIYKRNNNNNNNNKIYEIEKEKIIGCLKKVIKKVFGKIIREKNTSILSRAIVKYINTPKEFVIGEWASKMLCKLEKRQARERHILVQKILHNLVYFIFCRYIPFLLDTCTVNTLGYDAQPRFFFKNEYIQKCMKFKNEYIKKYFVEDDSSDIEKDKVDIYSIVAIPKKNTFRVITVKEDKSNTKKESFYSDNNTLYKKDNILAVFNKEINERKKWEITPEIYRKNETKPRMRTHTSIFALKDTLYRVKQFRSLYLSQFISGIPLYILILDIKNCFDSIEHSQMKKMGIPDKIFSRLYYKNTIYREITNKSMYGKRNIVTSPSEDIKIDNVLEEAKGNSMCRGYITENLIYTKEIEKEISESIFNHKVRYKGKIYRRVKGVAQGSPYSSHICSYYMAGLDEEMYKDLKYTKGIRYIDDTLVLSWSIEELQILLQRIEERKERTGMHLNISKCQFITASEIDKPFKLLDKIELINQKTFFWCGIHMSSSDLFPKICTEKEYIRTVPQNIDLFMWQIDKNINKLTSFYLFFPKKRVEEVNKRRIIKLLVKYLFLFFKLKNPGEKRKQMLIEWAENAIISSFSKKNPLDLDNIRKYYRDKIKVEQKKRNVFLL